jgi:hypothetical protein
MDKERSKHLDTPVVIQQQSAYLGRLSAGGPSRYHEGLLTLTATQSARTLASAQRFVLGGMICVEENILASSFQQSS